MPISQAKSRFILLVPVNENAGLNTVAIRFAHALQHAGINAQALPKIAPNEALEFLAQNNLNALLEKIIELNGKYAQNNDVVITAGLAIAPTTPFAMEVNFALATALDASIVFVSNIANIQADQFMQQLRLIANPYMDANEREILGLVFNQSPENPFDFLQLIEKYSFFSAIKLHIIANIPFLEKPKQPPHDAFFNIGWAKDWIKQDYERKTSSAIFRYQLITRARSAQKKIILPEGDEPRTIRAANICAKQDIAQCILVGNPQNITKTAAKLGVNLNKKLILLDPDSVRERYVQPLYELRKHKGMTTDEARAQLQDNVVLGTMMVQLGEVDGLVSGAVHTTANTIRPALQIIKTKPDTSIVSSVFFMCLPNQVLVYADCAINPNPTAEELADIAIQSADSAKIFGITPRIALLSYSTGTSGAGPSVEKIKEAATIASRKRPDLPIEGPIQYDAAIAKDVAALKLPNSKVAGRATIFIFPDLNAGNIACKAVQRSTNIVCIGPMLQGLRKPVNDLSRGCLVEDIVFTIAITAIQAKR